MVHKSSILAAAIAVFWKVITMLSIKNAHEHGGLSRAGKSHLAFAKYAKKERVRAVVM